jgi:N-ethylmaleimide reductase
MAASDTTVGTGPNDKDAKTEQIKDVLETFCGRVLVPVIGNTGFDKASGNEAIAIGKADAIAFGVPFLANPDLPERLRRNAPFNAPDKETFYGEGPKGYTD